MHQSLILTLPTLLLLTACSTFEMDYDEQDEALQEREEEMLEDENRLLDR